MVAVRVHGDEGRPNSTCDWCQRSVKPDTSQGGKDRFLPSNHYCNKEVNPTSTSADTTAHFKGRMREQRGRRGLGQSQGSGNFAKSGRWGLSVSLGHLGFAS